MDQKRMWLAILAALALAVSPAWAQEEAAPPADEPEDQVEEVIVVTASRTEQPLNEAPAAISVLTAKDIESIPATTTARCCATCPDSTSHRPARATST